MWNKIISKIFQPSSTSVWKKFYFSTWKLAREIISKLITVFYFTCKDHRWLHVKKNIENNFEIVSNEIILFQMSRQINVFVQLNSDETTSGHAGWYWSNRRKTGRHCALTLSPPISLRLYTLPYWSNPPFLIFDIRTLWRSVLSARASECRKLKMVG